jgi:hypothetical protein
MDKLLKKHVKNNPIEGSSMPDEADMPAFIVDLKKAQAEWAKKHPEIIFEDWND